MSYRPICDIWLLARSKTKYYGAYPSGFLSRARNLLGVGSEGSVLHVCGGKIRDYPFAGLGVNDKTLDLDPECKPDFLQDARDELPWPADNGYWDAILIDRPYTLEDAEHYVPGPDVLPDLNDLTRRSLQRVPIGGKVGVLDYLVPHPGKHGKIIALVGVSTGYNNRMRAYSVFERTNEPTSV